jgi:hypothetical protein
MVCALPKPTIVRVGSSAAADIPAPASQDSFAEDAAPRTTPGRARSNTTQSMISTSSGGYLQFGTKLSFLRCVTQLCHSQAQRAFRNHSPPDVIAVGRRSSMMDPAERTSSTLSGGAPQAAERRQSGHLQPARKRGLGVDAEITSERDVYFDTEVVRGEVTLIAEREVCVCVCLFVQVCARGGGYGGGIRG